MRGNGGIIGPKKVVTISSATGIWRLSETSSYKNKGEWPTMEALPGQVEYITSGTYSWICPDGVSKVHVVAVGGTQDSYFISTATVKGGGTNNGQTGGTYTGTGGGNGGSGGNASPWYTDPQGSPWGAGGAGGGAGGYTSNGTSGGSGFNNNNGVDGYSGGGGGVGIYGGAAGGRGGTGAGTGSSGAGGLGGSGGTTGQTGGGGGTYGGGGGGSWSGNGCGGGGLGWKNDIAVVSGQSYTVQVSTGVFGTYNTSAGAVRIIWGTGRSFPSTNTGNV